MEYTVKFVNHSKKTPKVHTVIEMDRYRLTRSDFRIIIAELSYWAARSCDYKAMNADVYRDGSYLFSVLCDTDQDGSMVKSTIRISRPGKKHETIRVMTVAA